MLKKIAAAAAALIIALSAAACGGSELKDADLSEVYAQITQQVELPENMTQISTTDMLMSFYGIEPADVKQFATFVSGVSIQVDEVVMIEAVDSAAGDRIERALETRRDAQYNANKNYLPDQAAVIDKCEVKREGNYVTLFISKDADKMTEIFNSAIGK